MSTQLASPEQLAATPQAPMTAGIYLASIFPQRLSKQFVGGAAVLTEPIEGNFTQGSPWIVMEPGSYEKPTIMHVPAIWTSTAIDTVTDVPGGAAEPNRGQMFVPVTQQKVRDALLFHWTSNNMEATHLMGPGVGQIAGPEITEEEKNALRQKQNLWFARLVELGDADADNGHREQFCKPGSVSRLAALELLAQGLIDERPWAKGVSGMQTQKHCLACGELIAVSAFVCKHCKEFLVNFVVTKNVIPYDQVEALDPFLAESPKVATWISTKRTAAEKGKPPQQTPKPGFSVKDVKIEPMTDEADGSTG